MHMKSLGSKPQETSEDKELLLREDRRLLGRLLGDVISEQVGAATREQIETIRQTAVRFRRTDADPASAGEAAPGKAELPAVLRGPSIDPTVALVPGLSHLLA